MTPRTAFVLGGGGVLGAAEVGMLKALLAAGIVPDLIVGTSIGAVNGALLAADPTRAGVTRLAKVWENVAADGPIGGSMRSRVSALASTRAKATSHPEPLRRLLTENLPVERFEDLQVRFECVAASIERAMEHWFTEGPIVPAVMASAALPGLFPPVRIDDEHFIDGGIVNSIPLDRARKAGAERAFVLQVGRVEQELSPAKRPWEVPVVAFEVARRARFHAALARSQDSLEVHVLPTGGLAPRPMDRANFDLFDTSRVTDRMDAAELATAEYLAEHLPARRPRRGEGGARPRSPGLTKPAASTPAATSAPEAGAPEAVAAGNEGEAAETRKPVRRRSAKAGAPTRRKAPTRSEEADA